MKREIVALVHGDVQALLACWQPPAGVAVDQAHGRAELVFTEGHLADYPALEAAVGRLKSNHEVELAAIFRKFDYTRDDLLAAELLWLRVGQVSGLVLLGEGPVVTARCPQCGYNSESVRPVERVLIAARTPPAGMVLGCDGLVFFDKSLVSQFAERGWDRGLSTLPCAITLPGGATLEQYVFVYSTADLGTPVNGMTYGEPCPSCRRPQVLDNRSFSLSYARGNWDGADFCCSQFVSARSVFISQRVFRLLDALSPCAMSEMSLEPVELT